MKPWMIKLIIGALGFGGGFAAGFFCHKKMNDIKFEEVTEEEFAEIEKKVQAQQKSEVKDIPEEKPAIVSDELGAAQEMPENTDDLRNFLQGKKPYLEADAEQKKAYEKMWKATKEYSSEENANKIPVVPIPTDEGEEEESPEEEDFDEEFMEQIEQEAVEAGNNFVDPPHQIDLIDFYNDHPEYDKVTIQWYQDDNVWIDDNEEIIPDISSYVGIETKNPFDEDPIDGDPDTRFWTNPRYGTDYEFIRHHRSYREATGE